MTASRPVVRSSHIMLCPSCGETLAQEDLEGEEIDRCAFDGVVRARDHDRAAGRLVLRTVELTRRQDIAREGCQDHASSEQNERMRNAEPSLRCRHRFI